MHPNRQGLLDQMDTAQHEQLIRELFAAYSDLYDSLDETACLIRELESVVDRVLYGPQVSYTKLPR